MDDLTLANWLQGALRSPVPWKQDRPTFDALTALVAMLEDAAGTIDPPRTKRERRVLARLRVVLGEGR